jgi:hypothetical protein
VAEAEVVFARPSGEVTLIADESGCYSMEIHPGFYRVFARADGYVAVGEPPIERIPSRLDPDSIGLPRSELAPLIGLFRDEYVDIHMRAGARITGSIFDSEGRPVANAVVSAKAGTERLVAGPGLVLGSDVDETDLDGSFVLEVAAGSIWLAAVHEDLGGLAYSPNNTLYLDPGDEAHVDLTMTAGCIINGRVVNSRGEPGSKGSLEAYVGGLPPNDYTPVSKLDDDGRFRFATPETEVVKLRAWPWKSAPTETREFDCTTANRYDGVVFVVPDIDPDLEGVIVTADGEPVADAFIDLFPLDAGGMAQQERADTSGEWAFFALPHGRYQLTAYVVGHGAVAQTVTIPSNDVRLVLSGTGSLMGTVQGMREGAFTLVVERCRLRTGSGDLVQFDEVSMPSTTILVPVERGEFRVDGLPACPIEGHAKTPYRVVRFATTITVGEVAVHALDLRQPKAKRIHGVVIDRERVPLGGISVLRIPDSGAPRSSLDFAISDDHGRYEIRAYSGDRLLVSDSEGVRTTVRVTWSGDEEAEIEVRLPR